jgi:hypothetical protein
MIKATMARQIHPGSNQRMVVLPWLAIGSGSWDDW